ncbi:uncharacterized, partial [Tachysurus ichikawai]
MERRWKWREKPDRDVWREMESGGWEGERDGERKGEGVEMEEERESERRRLMENEREIDGDMERMRMNES